MRKLRRFMHWVEGDSEGAILCQGIILLVLGGQLMISLVIVAG